MRQEKLDATFNLLVKDHGDRIYNLALMKSNQASLAEDITQETFIRVYRGLKNFRNESQIGTWIYKIALNVCNTMLTKESRISKPLIAYDEGGEHELSTESVDAENGFWAESRTDYLRKAIASLSPNQADVITLYYLREFKYEEVAQIMDIPINTVKSHLYRAKERLREIIQEVEI
ncbi:MAG: sigma-70 family RNA polymerase sigma factor [Candidatus Marinimicrobia bacterium]|nr:sigma-70 family RNA polymerase sigma factor [Candidatus Neomarinimicrobiota bacterium]